MSNLLPVCAILDSPLPTTFCILTENKYQKNNIVFK